MADPVEASVSADHNKVINRILDAYFKASGTTVNDRVYNAFRALQAERGIGTNSLDLELGCAEHYMYARFLAGKTGDPWTVAGGKMYDLLKKSARTVGAEKLIRKHDNPTLPPHPDLVRWGEQGARDGLQDFRSANPDKPLKTGPALRIMAESMAKIIQDKVREQLE
jgi:hypothetical protein